MIERKFEPSKPHRYITYTRMSTKKQNERSPAQQRDNIERERRNQKCPWKHVRDYEDGGVSGRLTRKRPDLQRMLRDIRSGELRIDLILIDTLDRFGRTDEVIALRKELYEQHGILILTADSHFADPNTPQGSIYNVFEAVRAKDDGRVKAHQVLRGKKDAVERGYWPGGEAPFGFQLKSEFGIVYGREEKLGSRLEPFPETDWIARLAFERVKDTGEGQTRVVNFLNAHPDIDSKYKPFSGSSIGWMLDNEIYKGEFHFPKHATDIVNDVVIKQLVPAEECIVYPNFCPAIVTAETWDTVQAIRVARRNAILLRRASTSPQKLIAPLVTGVSIRYLLSGLMRCGHCGSAMRPTGASKMKDPDGMYVYYRCPRNVDGGCDNSTTVREVWIRNAVIELLANRLFGSHTK